MPGLSLGLGLMLRRFRPITVRKLPKPDSPTLEVD